LQYTIYYKAIYFIVCVCVRKKLLDLLISSSLDDVAKTKYFKLLIAEGRLLIED